MDRRTFLSSLAAATIATACTTDGDESASNRDKAEAPRRAVPKSAALSANSFSLGVASGDPTADSVMLWTRLCSDPLVDGGGSPTSDVEVAYDVATDEEFAELVASGIALATADLAHSVHVDVTGLASDSWYYYRFRAGEQTSPVGRTRTFPKASASKERLKFAVASCQDFQWGYYGAWAHVAVESDLDAVVFLGDYIYESNLGDLSPDKSAKRVWATAKAETLSEYRLRYAQTKADPQLQAAHHVVPWLTTFDDHEVANNYAGDVGEFDAGEPKSRDRRLAAYQAWYEHTPIRVESVPTSFDAITVHRSVTFGSLASIFAIETRQHADPPPCRTAAAGFTDDGPDCDERNDPARTNLGEVQEKWLSGALADSESQWNILANPLMLAGINIGTAAEPLYTRDAWDGYPVVRRRLLDHIVDSKVSNPVVVTGDWHASFVLDVKAEPDGPVLMPEFLASSITTFIFGTDYRAENPHIRYFVGEHCYGLVTVTPDDLLYEFKYIADVWDPETKISHVDGWRVTAGDPTAVQA